MISTPRGDGQVARWDREAVVANVAAAAVLLALVVMIALYHVVLPRL
jgi:hypothetical protein